MGMPIGALSNKFPCNVEQDTPSVLHVCEMASGGQRCRWSPYRDFRFEFLKL